MPFPVTAVGRVRSFTYGSINTEIFTGLYRFLYL